MENSNPEILSSYPGPVAKRFEKVKLIPKFLPYGSNLGDFQVNYLEGSVVLSYIFKIDGHQIRDSLLSISIMLKKKQNMEIFKPILKKIIEDFQKHNILTEHILVNNLNNIFDGINQEKDIIVEGFKIEIAELYKELKLQYLRTKPQLEGNFF